MQFKKILLIILASLSWAHAFACTEAMQPFKTECAAQDLWNRLTLEYQKSNVSINDVKGFAVPRAIGNKNFFESKNDFLNHSETALPQNKDWLAWTKGKKFFNENDPVFLEVGDVLKLHKAMFSGTIDAGRLRVVFGETNPKYTFSCEDKVLTKETSDLFENFDIKSSEGYSLLELKNTLLCQDGKTYSADVVFYKGASMKTELKSWLADYNDMMNRYAHDAPMLLTPPFAYLADMKRWFLAIHPFTFGNELIANVLIEYASAKIELPPLISVNNYSYLMGLNENRSKTLKATQESLSFLETCLFDIKTNFVAPQCSSL
jgi:hypothetical protein